MAYSLQKLHPVIVPSLKPIMRPSLQVRAHSRKDEGISGKLVDANLSMLWRRIEIVKMKEKLENCCGNEMGWNYAVGYSKPKICEKLTFFVQLFGWAIGTIGLTIASGSLCLALISLLVHSNQ